MTGGAQELRALHLVNASRGGRWASSLAKILTQQGVEVHVALPSAEGPAAGHWRQGGAQVHPISFSLSLSSPRATRESVLQLRRLVDRLCPSLVHSHTLTTAMLSRIALRRHSSLLRIFHVPGPFHLDYGVFRVPELALATSKDYWIASSRAILRHYMDAGVDRGRVFLSYSGTDNSQFQRERTGWLRTRLGLNADHFIVGNVNYFYSPMKFLVHKKTGVKCHEDLIEGISLAAARDPSIRGVLIGGPWGSDPAYFERLRALAQERCGAAIVMPGPMDSGEVAQAIPDFDCVAHVPSSENCGGVVEPLLCGVPVIASRVGGLTEVVMDAITGTTVPVHNPQALASAILQIRAHYATARDHACTGQALVETMFNVERTGMEVFEIYRYLLGQVKHPPDEFDSAKFLGGPFAAASRGVLSSSQIQ